MQSLSYQQAKNMPISKLREQMRTAEMNSKGNKQALLNRIKYYYSKKINSESQPPFKRRKIVLSIHYVLPKEIVQHILSFELWATETKMVCRTFKEAAEQNERNYYRTLVETMNIKCPVPYDCNMNNTWIVDPNIRQLTQVEEDLGFEGPIHYMNQAIHNCKSGDRIFVHNGIYEMSEMCIDKDVSIIAVGTSAIITNKQSEYIETFWQIGRSPVDVAPGDKCTKVYLENLRFNLNCRYIRFGIEILEGKGWLKECELISIGEMMLYVEENTHLMVENCGFEKSSTAIGIASLANEVKVTNSIFRNHGSGTLFEYCGEFGCILINVQSYGPYTDGTETFVRLNCEGNIFEDNLCYPIAERCRYDENTYETVTEPIYIDKMELYHLKDNILKGYNGSKVLKRIKPIENANVMYYNNEDLKIATFDI